MGIFHHDVAANSALSNQVILVEDDGSLASQDSFSSATRIALLVFYLSSKVTCKGPTITAALRWLVCLEKWSI